MNNRKKNLLRLTPLIAIAFPVISFAAATQFTALGVTLDSFLLVINALINVGYGLAFLALIWGVVKYIFSAGDEEAKGAGQRIMIGGVIGLFVITAIWGLVAFVGTSLGITNTTGTTAQFKVQALGVTPK